MTILPVNYVPKMEDPLFTSVSADTRELLSEEAFRRMIAIERKRTERSNKPFLLMLLEAGHYQGPDKNGRVLDSVAPALMSSTRETDVIGWYKERTAVGVIYTGLLAQDKNSSLSIILNRVNATLRGELMFDQFSQVTISFHFFPDDWNHDNWGAQPILRSIPT